MGKYIEVSELKRYCEKCADAVKGIHETVMDKIGHGESNTSAIGAMAYFMQKENTYRNEIPNVISNFVDDYRLVDVAPVVHGKWLTWEEKFPGKTPTRKNNLGVFCIVCGNHADNRHDFCPSCGADMRKAVE